MKGKHYQSRLQQQLTTNYNICQMIVGREGVHAGLPLLKYQQLMYLILNGRIPISKIAYFKNKKYVNQQPLLRRTFLIQDGVKISTEVIQKAWRFERSSEKPTNNRQKTPNKSDNQNFSHQSTMDIKQVKNTTKDQSKQPQQPENNQNRQKQQVEGQNNSANRVVQRKNLQKSPNKLKIQELKQTLAFLQGKINSSKKQQQILQNQKQYNRYFKELQYLRNQKRIKKEQMLLKRIQEDNCNKSPQTINKLNELLQQMNKIKNQNAKILNKIPNFQQKISKAQQINRISIIFSYYAKKKVGKSQRYFSDMQKQINYLNIQVFLKFVQDWKLNRILTLDKLVNIFKVRSKGKKNVNMYQFTEILNDIHVHQCISEQKSLTNESSSQYIQEYIVDQEKMNKILLNRDKRTKTLKSLPQQQVQQQVKNKLISNYKFKPKPLGGKYIHDVKQQLLSKKQMVDFLAGPKNALKYQNRNSMNLRNNTAESSKIQMGTIQASLYNPTVSIKDTTNNSYAFQFKKKKNKKRFKTEDILSSQIKNGQENAEVQQQNLQNINSRITQTFGTQILKKKIGNSMQLKENSDEDKELQSMQKNIKGNKSIDTKNNMKRQGLEDLINESQQDQYLKKFILPPIKQRKSFKYVHY